MGIGAAAGDKNRTSPEDDDSSDSLRELVLQAGLELLDREGLSLTFDSISYAKVFDYLSNEYEVTVTRGSVHERIWASQDDFRRDVLTESVGYFPPNGISEALADRDHTSDNANDFAKGIGSATISGLVRSEMSGRFQSVKALASWFDDPLATETLHRLLDERSEAVMAEIRALFPATLTRLGLRPRSSLGLTADQATDLCGILIGSLTEGGRLNYHAGSHDVTAPIGFLSTPEDADDPWRSLSIGVKAILDILFEPGPTDGATPETLAQATPYRAPKVEPNSHRSDSGSSRRPRAQLRELVLIAAVELLLRDGPQLRPELLNYTSVLAHLKEGQGVTVHRSSVHPKVWKTNNDFRNEVLTRSLADTAYPVRAVTDVVVALEPVRRADQSVDRPQTACRIFRMAGAALPGVEAESVAYRRLLQVKAALIDQQDSTATRELRTTVADVERLRLDGNKAELQTLVLDHGFRARPETGLDENETLELFEVLTMTTAAGIMLNQLAGITAATRTFMLNDSEGGGPPQEWTPLGLSMRAYFEQLYEEDPS